MRNNKILMPGEKIGNLTILGRIKGKSEKDNHIHYKTLCDCGNEREVSATYLKTGKITKCKECVKKERIENNLIKPGTLFGKLTVLENVGKKGNDGHHNYLVKCECGNTQIIRGSLLITGKRVDCYKCSKKRTPQYKHGFTNTRLFHIWQGIIARCNNKNSQAYKDYGGRGIKICDVWKNNFINFYNWAMANGYKEDLTIDRIDVNGNYEPNNCRWADRITQANNIRNNRRIEFNGETHTMAEWSKITGISYNKIERRINKYKWSVLDALTKP